MKDKMTQKIIDKLEQGYIISLAKPDIDKFERAELIMAYMKKHVLSMSEFCRRFNLPKGTVCGWIKWSKLGKDKYDALINKGHSETEITNMLKQEDYSREKQLQSHIATIMTFTNHNKLNYTPELIKDILELRNKLNYLLYKFENDGK